MTDIMGLLIAAAETVRKSEPDPADGMYRFRALLDRRDFDAFEVERSGTMFDGMSEITVDESYTIEFADRPVSGDLPSIVVGTNAYGRLR